MKTILITGGTGTLGREIVRQLLLRSDFQVRVLSSKNDARFPEAVRVVRGDLTKPSDLQDFFTEVETIIHCASNPANAQVVDVEGTRNLLKLTGRMRLNHFIYVSIVGVDQSDYPYYQSKYEAEKIISGSGLPFTILRATQFHDLVLNRLILPADRQDHATIVLPAGMSFQSIDVRDVALKIEAVLDAGASQSTHSIGGPEVFSLEEMTRLYLDVRGKQKNIRLDPEDDSFSVFKSGVNLCPGQKYGKIGWKQYLQEVYIR